MSTTPVTPKDRLLTAASKLGLAITSEFVPWHQSRSRNERQPSLNWRVTILHNGKPVLETDYSAGCAHAPSYASNPTVDQYAAMKWECEHGYKARLTASGTIYQDSKARLEPVFADVLHSLVLDSDVMEYPTFEAWAGDFGYDPDSRKAEQTYRACLDIGLKLHAAIGSDGLTALREAGQDY